MATISTRLMISGTAVTSDPIAVDYSKSNNVSAPAIETGGFDIAAGADVEIYNSPATTPTRTFLYIKNTGAVGQNFVTIVFKGLCEATLTAFTIGRLELGEFLYLPIAPGTIINVASSATGTARVEYGYFSAA